MTSVWDFFKNLFNEAEQSSASKPLIHGAIERSEKEIHGLRLWKESEEKQRIVAWLNDQYAIWQALPDDTHEAVDFLDTASSKGFALHFNKMDIEAKNASFLFDYLQEMVLGINYKAQMSDSRTWSEKKAVIMVERHYLKPRTSKSAEAKIDQQFGNITIELEFRDNAPFNLKFRATGYHDRLYKKASDFKELLAWVLQ